MIYSELQKHYDAVDKLGSKYQQKIYSFLIAISNSHQIFQIIIKECR